MGDEGAGGCVVIAFEHLEMAQPLGGYLGEMGDCEDLHVAAYVCHEFAHAVGDIARHTGVYFIEYYSRQVLMFGCHGFQGEHHA